MNTRRQVESVLDGSKYCYVFIGQIKAFLAKRAFFPKRAKWVGMESSLCLCRTSVQVGLELGISRLKAEH